MDEAYTAEKLQREASAAYADASARYEFAVMSGDAEARRAALAALDEAGEQYARAGAAAVQTRRRAMPSFEQVLADPTCQPDLESQILQSILAFAAAKPASAGRPVQNVQVYATTASSVVRTRAVTAGTAARRLTGAA